MLTDTRQERVPLRFQGIDMRFFELFYWRGVPAFIHFAHKARKPFGRAGRTQFGYRKLLYVKVF